MENKDNKDLKIEELNDEQLHQVAGGGGAGRGMEYDISMYNKCMIFKDQEYCCDQFSWLPQCKQ